MARRLTAVAYALLLIATPALAQQADTSVVTEFPFYQHLVSAMKALMAVVGFVSIVCIILVTLYGVIVHLLGPTTWYRWHGLITVVEEYKKVILGFALFPFAFAALIYIVGKIVAAYGGDLGITPEDAALKFITEVFVSPFKAFWEAVTK